MSTNAERALYLDSSALVKLVVPEAESASLRAYVTARSPLASCSIARVEVVRAVGRHSAQHVDTARELLDALDLAQLDDELLDLAADLDAPLRSLDAIHIAAAMEFGDELEALVTYDAGMARAAQALGLAVVSPA